MRRPRHRVWNGWNIDKLCNVDGDLNSNLYIGKLRLSEAIDKTIPDINNLNRVTIDRSIYSNGYIRILCTLRRSTNPNVLYHRSLRS